MTKKVKTNDKNALAGIEALWNSNKPNPAEYYNDWCDIGYNIEQIYKELVKDGKANEHTISDLVEFLITNDVVYIDFWDLSVSDKETFDKVGVVRAWVEQYATDVDTWANKFGEYLLNVLPADPNAIWDGRYKDASNLGPQHKNGTVDRSNIKGIWFNQSNNDIEDETSCLFIHKEMDPNELTEMFGYYVDVHGIEVSDEDVERWEDEAMGEFDYDSYLKDLEKYDVNYKEIDQQHPLLKKYSNVDFSKKGDPWVFGFNSMEGYRYCNTCFAYLLLDTEAWTKVKSVKDVKALITELAESVEEGYGWHFGENNTDVIEYYTRLFLCLEYAVTGKEAFRAKYKGLDFVPESVQLSDWVMYVSESYIDVFDGYWEFEKIIKNY